ncbi:hypothetical protein KUTeg_004799 [Tegillarca granosa]|uniref:Uncharacterized protein n=1 Tax=Tegillarca granosa TaxID=220873 RepID=A0ABQ9FHW8_TEGGR|nr:hypothetical protein KUTeg_004799 [Tegillarca granosa]
MLSGNPLKDVFYSNEETKEVNHQCGVTKATQTDENGNDTQNLVRNLVSNLISQAVHEMLNMDCDEEASDFLPNIKILNASEVTSTERDKLNDIFCDILPTRKRNQKDVRNWNQNMEII